MDWSNDLMLEFLKYYEEEPVIWDPKYPNHKNRHYLNAAWQRIQNRMSVPCSVHSLKKKKESLMATFRHLAAKVKISQNTSASEDVYTPSWFAFKAMARFLEGIYEPKREGLLKEANDVEDILYEVIAEDESIQSQIAANEEDININKTIPQTRLINQRTAQISKTVPSSVNRISKKKRKIASHKIERRMAHAINLVQSISEVPDKDLCSQYANLLATKLRTFNEQTRDILMHEIDSLIFKAKMKERTHHFQAPSSTLPSRGSPFPQRSYSLGGCSTRNSEISSDLPLTASHTQSRHSQSCTKHFNPSISPHTQTRYRLPSPEYCSPSNSPPDQSFHSHSSPRNSNHEIVSNDEIEESKPSGGFYNS